MSDTHLDTLVTSPTDALSYAAANGLSTHTQGDLDAYELCGVLPARPVSAAVVAYLLTASTTGAERAALVRVAQAKSEAERAVARENLRLVKLALLAA